MRKRKRNNERMAVMVREMCEWRQGGIGGDEER